jgi:alpha-beta hydrolase superfamily lysophospholipase
MTGTSEEPRPGRPDTVVLIHGLWMTIRSWEHWAEHLAGRGYQAVVRGWPGLEKDVEDLRRDPSPLEGLGITEIVDHYDAIIRDLPRPPIIMGHSFGGLITQLLLDRGLGAAGVAIAPAAPRGVFVLPPSTLRTAWPALRNPANRKRAVPLSVDQFHYRFTNDLDEAATQAAYDRYYVPGSGRMLFQAGLANVNPRAATRIDFANAGRAPLLLIAGGKDHVSPPAVVRANAQKQRQAPSATDYVLHPERTHFTAGEPGWEKVVDQALDWSVEHAAAPPDGS